MVKNILGWYEDAFGQKINFAKSIVTLSPNVVDNNKRAILVVLGMSVSQSHDKYLNLPTIVGKNEQSSFNAIKEKVWKKLQSWKDGLFLVGEKRDPH